MKMKDLAIDLLEMALARRDEPAALATALIALDKLSQSGPDHASSPAAAGPEPGFGAGRGGRRSATDTASCHYAAGRILLVMGQPQLAMGALRLACQLDPEHASAHYYEGVAHWLMGNKSEALTKVLHALHMEPDLFEARYDAGVIYYQFGDHVAALEHLKRALELRPDDFSTLKKLLQCLLALDYHGTAQLTHQRLRQVWATSEDPAVRAVRSYVLDQFAVGPLHLVAIESLAPEGDPAVLYSFAAHDSEGLAFTVTLETSRALRGGGGGWVLAVSDGAVHANTGMRWSDPPGYHLLKPSVIQLVKRWAGVGDDGATP